MVKCLELAEISAELSHKLTELNAPLTRIAKVHSSRVFTVEPRLEPVGPEEFWADDLDHAILSQEEKEKLYLQLQRSGSNSIVLSFVMALQELCDNGVALYHEGQPVVDIWVLHTNEFDVSDIKDTRFPVLVDPITGFTLPAMPTYENMDSLRKQGNAVCARLGFQVPERNRAGDHFKKHRHQSFKTSMPHTWVAAITEGSVRGLNKERRMVHIDICGAAFDDAGFRRHNGSLVSLQIFITPEYSLMPRRRMRKSLGIALVTRDKFVMETCTRPAAGSWKKPMLALQPFSVRHLRCFHRKDDSIVSVTVVTMYTARNTRYILDSAAEWFGFIADLRRKIMLQLPAGTEVIVCNLEKRPELNGRKGRVHDSIAVNASTERIPVWVTGICNPLSLKTTCIRLTERRQYLSHEELRESVESAEVAPWERDQLPPMSSSDIQKFQSAVTRDPDMRYAYEVLGSRKYTMSCYIDPRFNKGVRKILVPPFDKIMPPGMARAVRNGMRVADHSKSKEIYSILKVMKTAKQKVLEKNPSLARSDGTVTVPYGSDHRRLLEKIIEKIEADPELSEMFHFMDVNGMFPNPVTRLRRPIC